MWAVMSQKRGEEGIREKGQPSMAGNPRPSTLTQPGCCRPLSEKSCSQAEWHCFLRKTVETASGNHLCWAQTSEKNHSRWTDSKEMRGELPTRQGPQEPAVAIGATETQQGGWRRIVNVLWKILILPPERGSLELRCEHQLALLKDENICIINPNLKESSHQFLLFLWAS